MPIGKTSAKRIQLTQRRADALEVRKSGASYRKVAEAIRAKWGLEKYSRQLARQDVLAELKIIARVKEGTIRELRAFELSRLERIILAAWRPALQGSTDHINSLLKALKLKADLLGLFPPKDFNVTCHDDRREARLRVERLLAEIAAESHQRA